MPQSNGQMSGGSNNPFMSSVAAAPFFKTWFIRRIAQRYKTKAIRAFYVGNFVTRNGGNSIKYTVEKCPAEAGPPGQESSQGTARMYKVRELFEPKDSLRSLGLSSAKPMGDVSPKPPFDVAGS
ncbi:hypothetical protein NHQ30_011293 [Ciborinia camelliae]|nr:hypothetical protein NHQ30_011293 [Ciborinia camelliae]